MPAVLIELGFLTNPDEEDFLNSERGQSYMASAIFRAIRDYKAQNDVLGADRISKQNLNGEQVKEPKTASDLGTKKVSEETKKNDSKKLTAPEGTPSEVLKVEPQSAKPNEGVFFAVQILTLSSKKKPGDPVFKGLNNVESINEGGLYKYYVRPTKSFSEAKAQAKSLQQLGFKGAFVIGIENGRKISAVEARKKLQ